MVAAVRTFLTFLAVVLIVAAAVGLFLYFTTPHETAGVRFPLSADERAVLANVPATANAFVYIPRAAALQAKLARNPMTRDVVASWRAERSLPRAWMIGSADLLMWQSGKQTRYLLRLDPVRATLVRTFLTASDGGNAVLINATAETPISSEELSRIETLAAHLPAGDALVVQRENSRSGYPPIGRPAVSSIAVSDNDINIQSVSPATATAPSTLRTRFARSAMLSASFQTPPRMLDDLNRLAGNKLSTLLSDGGSVSLYDVDTRKFLPRPLGVIAVPASSERRPAADLLQKIGARTAEKDGDLVIAFDESINAYRSDTVDTNDVAQGKWAVRLDAQRLAPVLEQVKDNVGLRIASPRLFRGARDLYGWIDSLKMAKSIEAADRIEGSTEQLNVRVTAK